MWDLSKIQMQKLLLNEKLGAISYEIKEQGVSAYTLILAHGAGAGMHHPFMQDLAERISGMDGRVILFNLPYMEQGRSSPGSPKPNIETIGQLVDFAMANFPDEPVLLSGKSYGGRMSSHWVAEHPDSKVAGLVYFGFPLHAPGRDSKDRAAHIYDIPIPQLFIQGTNDKLANFGMINEVAAAAQHAKLHEIPHGDHSFKVPKRISNMSAADVMDNIATAANSWITENV